MAPNPKTSTQAPKPAPTPAAQAKPRRKQIQQTDVPLFGVEEAVRVARVLGDDYAFAPSTPLEVAKGLGMQPGTGPFRMILGASAAYGFTEGSAWADKVSITPLGRRAVRPQAEGDDLAARREALQKPRIIRDFLVKYNTSKLPREEIAQNVLEGAGIPLAETKRVFKQIVADAKALGLLTDINGVEYVQLASGARPATSAAAPVEEAAPDAPWAPPAPPTPQADTAAPAAPQLGRVYITHGKNTAFVDLLKKFLQFGDMEAVVSVQKETAAVSISAKVMDDMRSCGAAIIHVDAERHLMDADGKDEVVLNSNVLIEIGAAMALYGERFTLLVKEGVQLPSNISGLYQVRYQGDTLDAEAAMKVLEAIADIKKRPLPGAG